ncbi:MAG: alpha/beta fold hydrolase [Gemmobacter sp.]
MSDSPAPILRRFVTVAGRQTHLRQTGSGPAVLVLHQTPQSSATMEPMLRLLPGVTAIAPDSPGFGLSDPLPGRRWDMARLADWLSGLMDALGIARAGLIGQHTGAAIAADFARRHPGRATSLAADGLPAFTAAERATILPHQLPRFRPATDGAHLVCAWSRFRDGWMFFPRSDHRLARRRALDLPPPELIQTWQLMELLRSGESYRAVYPGVFAWDGAAALRGLSCPALIGADAGDQLFDHLDRLPDGLPGVTFLRTAVGDRAGLWRRLADFTLSHAGAATPPAPSRTGAASGPRAYVRLTGDRHVLIHRREGPAAPVVLLHGAGSAGEVELARSPPLRACLALDLPGHGNSDPPARSSFDPAALARDVGAVLDALGLDRVSLRGRGLGAAVGVELARARPDRIGRLRVGELALLSETEAETWTSRLIPDLAPCPYGTHLVRLWHALRDDQMFWPRFDTRAAAARRIEPMLDADHLARRFFAALRCADLHAAHAAWLRWDVRSRMAGLNPPPEIAAVPGDGWARDAAALAALAGGRVVSAASDGDGLDLPDAP